MFSKILVREPKNELKLIRSVSSFLLCAFLPLFAWSSLSASSKAIEEDKSLVAATILMQTHKPIGTAQVTITKTALKMFFPDFRTCLIASAPDWHVAYYNPGTRAVHNFSYANFSKFGSNLSACGEYPETGYKKSAQASVAGVNTDCHETKDKNGDITEVCAYDCKDIDPKIIVILSKIYRLPNFGGLPLAAYSESVRGEKIAVNAWLPAKEIDGKHHRYYRLQTTSLKQAKRSPSDFKYPSGFKETEDESSISFGHRADGLIDFLTADDKFKPKAKPINKTP